MSLRAVRGLGRVALTGAATAVALAALACGSDGGETGRSGSSPAAGGGPSTPPPIEQARGNEPLEDHEHEGDEGLTFDHHGSAIHETTFYGSTVQNGVEVEFTMQSFLGVGGRGADLASEIVDGASSAVIFNVTDSGTREPIAGLRPLAWLSPDDGSDASCEARVEGYFSGALTDRPLVDFNSFFVLALNDDPLISVIDPNVDVGGYTQLYTTMLLRGRGEDWAMSRTQNNLVVTIPSRGELAIADLESFVVLDHLPVGENPMRVAYSPDGAFVWVGNDLSGGRSGVTIVSVLDRRVVGHVDTGGGHHEIAFSANGRFTYVTNEAAGTLSVVDAERQAVVSEVQLGEQPTGLTVDPTTGAVYVATRGAVAVVDPRLGVVVSRIETGPGRSSVHLAPGGRWGFVASEEIGVLYVFDTTTNEVAYAVPVPGGPDNVTFSEDVAYARSLRTPEVVSIPLSSLGAGAEIEVSIVPVGQRAPSGANTSLTPSPVFTAPGAGALLVANPADDQVYFYPEGARAVSGSFQGHGLKPRSVQVVERNLKESVPGVFTGKLRIPSAGDFLVTFLLDSPRVLHCFKFSARPSGADEGDAQNGRPKLEFVGIPGHFAPGERASLRFVLLDDASEQPLRGIEDATALVSHLGGNWSEHYTAMHLGDGIYEVAIMVPRSGLYQVFVAIPSLGAGFEDLRSLSLSVSGPG